MASMQPFGGLDLELEFPQSVGTFAKYDDAQAAVDHLADQKFPVENLAIVGTDLKLVERVRGRRDWSTVLSSAVTSGVSTGVVVGLLLMLFGQSPSVTMFVAALVLAIVVSVVFNAIGYALSSGKRDFVSITQTVPNQFEILCEHKFAAQARELLLQRPGGRAHLFE